MARNAIRTSRETEAKVETYTPPFSYDIPEEVREQFASKGYHLRWVRIVIENGDDIKNIADRRREGYEPVTISELPEEFRDLFEVRSVGQLASSKYANVVTVGDLALFKITLAKAQARHKYYEDMAANNERAVLSRMEGSNKRMDRLLPIQNDSTSTVRVGTKPAEFGKTLKSTVKDSDEEE